MDHMPFIIAAFGVTIAGVGWLVISSYIAMRRSEALAKDVSARSDMER